MNSGAKRQVAVRLILAGCAYLVVGVVAFVFFWHSGYTTGYVTHAVIGESNYTTKIMQANRSVYQENPGPVIVILLLMFVATTLSTASVVYRVKKRWPGFGITGLIVACLVGVFSILGMLTIGPFILPLAVILLILAMPMSRLRGSYVQSRLPPPY